MGLLLYVHVSCEQYSAQFRVMKSAWITILIMPHYIRREMLQHAFYCGIEMQRSEGDCDKGHGVLRTSNYLPTYLPGYLGLLTYALPQALVP